MTLINFIHSTIKTLSLAFLSITHSFNYLNYISFLLIIIRDKEKMEMPINLYIILFFIIYDIIRFFTSNLTFRISRIIGDHAYYCISICILSVINLIFSFVAFHYSNIFIFIFYRISISLFNNIAQYIDLPIFLLYTRRQFPYKKRNFSLFQKFSNFLFFFVFLCFYDFFSNFYIFCFFLSVLNLLCFIISLLILVCNRENAYNQYYPNYSEKENINTNYIRPKLISKNNGVGDKGQKNKNNLNISDNNEIIVAVDNNNNSTNINSSIINNNTDNLGKNNNNNSNISHSNSLSNKVKIEEQIAQNEIRNNNTSQTLRGFLFPFLFSESNINTNLYPEKIKEIIQLLILFTILKSLNFFSLFMLIFKISKIKIFYFIDKNNNDLLFSDFSQKFHISSLIEEYLFLLMCFYFLIIILYFINISYTSIALKKKIINNLFYYFSIIIFSVASTFFVYYYLQNSDNTKISIEKVRKDIISFFGLNLAMNECTMIMSIYYNIIGKNKKFGERFLKEIKSLSIFFGSVVFLLIQTLIVFINYKNVEKSFESYCYYVIFSIFIFIIFLISIFL